MLWLYIVSFLNITKFQIDDIENCKELFLDAKTSVNATKVNGAAGDVMDVN